MKSFFNKTTRVYILALVKDGEERPTCEVDDNTYYDGDLFETKCNRDLRCICMPGYIGMKQKITFFPHVPEKINLVQIYGFKLYSFALTFTRSSHVVNLPPRETL